MCGARDATELRFHWSAASVLWRGGLDFECTVVTDGETILPI